MARFASRLQSLALRGTPTRRWPAIAVFRRPLSATAVAVWKQEILFAEAPVAGVEQAAEHLFHLVLDISANPELRRGHTKAGQFVQVKVGASKPAFLAIASPPQTAEYGALEFLIKQVDGSTAGLLCGLRKGDKVELSQVMGNGFAVDRLSPADQFSTVLLFATGSGISPIRSLIEAGFDARKRSDVRLYYGTRNLQRMAYQDKFKEWESSGVKIVPVLSQPGDDWTGECGYVQAAFAETEVLFDPLQAGAILCGQKEMAQDVTSLLIGKGLPEDKILKNF